MTVKNIFSSSWALPKAKTILLCMLGITIITAIGYFKQDAFFNQKEPLAALLGPLFGAFFIGLLLMTVQFLFSWQENIEREKLSLLGLKNVLGDKRDPVYYGALIEKAEKRIYIIGKTASHFLEDFANEHGSRKESRNFLEALGRGVEVKILLPLASHLPESSRANADATKNRFTQLVKQYGNLKYRYFDHPAYHSVFVADDNVIIGPYFPDLPSMDTPTLHLTSRANLPQKYLEYFEQEWNRCPDPN